MLGLEPVLKARITLGPPQELGETPHGRRRIIPITGGAFTGARLSGRVLAGGADWQLVRRDGVAELEARYTLQTSDGALIYVANNGYRHGPPEVMLKLAAGEAVDRGAYYMRTTPRFETADERYAWLNRMVFVATGARHAFAVELDVFQVQ